MSRDLQIAWKNTDPVMTDARAAMDYLSAYGPIPTKGRYVIDRNRVTGGGITAGIDFGLALQSL